MESRLSKAALRRTKACDACHRRKIRCDGEEGNPKPCSYCVKNGYECHFTYRPNKWPPSKTYVDGLERRVDYLERRVDVLKREVTRLREGGASGSGYVSSDSDDFDPASPPHDEDEDDAEALREMTEKYEGLWLSSPNGMRVTSEPRMYHGRASHMYVLNRQMAEMGQENLDKAKEFQLRVRPEFRYLDPDLFDHIDLSANPPTWPEPDLAQKLIDAFFKWFNSVFPLLHRPTFMRQYADPAMRLDRDWTAVAFGVFALASKYVDDPRVLPASGSWYAAGQRFWKEMRRIMSPFYAPPTLFRLQALVLFIWYFSGSSLFPSAGWALIGLSLRYVQDAGMHRKKEWTKRAAAHPFEYELRKRVFWVLYVMERTVALEMDRSFCLQEDEHDLDLLMEVDDTGLDLLQQGQKSPPGFSLTIATFNARMRLLSFASRKRSELRTIRRLSKESEVIERERYWLQSVRIKFDHFKANLPERLRYSEDERNDEDFLMKALLEMQYHQAQFAMYRAFLSREKRHAHASEPILQTCCDISSTVASILDKLRERNLCMGRIHETALGGFMAGTVLLIDMWENRNWDHMEDVDKCIQAIKAIEDRWQWPGRVHDVLVNLREVVRITLGDGTEKKSPDNNPPAITANGEPPCNGVTTTNGQSSGLTTQPQNPFRFIGADNTQPPAPYHSFAPLLPDGIMNADVDSLFTAMQPPAPASAIFGDQPMSATDWSFAGGQDNVESEFNDWLNNMIFSIHPPAGGPIPAPAFPATNLADPDILVPPPP